MTSRGRPCVRQPGG